MYQLIGLDGDRLRKKDQSSSFQLACVCLPFSNCKQKTKGGNECYGLCFFLSFSFHTLYKLHDARPSCSLLFFSIPLKAVRSKKTENGDHHITFDVTIEIGMRAPLIFFMPTTLYCPFSFIIIRLLFFFVSDTRERENRFCRFL